MVTTSVLGERGSAHGVSTEEQVQCPLGGSDNLGTISSSVVGRPAVLRWGRGDRAMAETREGMRGEER